MENLEKPEILSNEKISEPEKAFEALMITNLLQTYQKSLKEAGFTDEEVLDFLNEASEYDHEDLQKILSLPYELRHRTLSFLCEDYRAGKIDIKGVVKDIYDTANDNGFYLGYHTTPHKIKKTENNRGKEVWNVEGSENDHRDGDLRMAYYSRDYENIYTQKNFEYVYIIRGNEEHRNDTKWYRAPTLPIVDELEMNSADIQQWFIEYQKQQEELSNTDEERKTA